MRVSYNWLKDYVDVNLPPKELADALTGRGVVVETLTCNNPGVEGVLVGRVDEIARHPNAETLWICQVDVGTGSPLQIVTGAPNVRQGDLVPVAVPGATLPGQTMGVATFRGVQSHGMLCSPEELGIDEGGDGILILPPDPELAPGQDAAEVLGLYDWILDLDLTANYAAHCQSMVGIAQEVAAILGVQIRPPEINIEQTTGSRTDKLIKIRIDAPDLCSRYAARVVHAVAVGPSPAWLQARIRAAGMRPISNIVDITNFVMLELGQPLHAFDHQQIGGRQIIVRRAGAGERFTTLDDQERTLDESVLVIADGKKPIALAGVMGGLDSEVTDRTTDVLIESAHFDNINNRRTALRYNLPSEAARRFTKGVDPSGCVRAADRAAQLMALIAGGSVAPGHVDEYPVPAVPAIIPLRTARVNGLLGLDLTAAQMVSHLENLNLVVLDPESLALDLAQGRPEAGEAEGDDLSGRPVWTAIHQVSPVPQDPDAYGRWAGAAWSAVEAAAGRLEEIGPEGALVVVVPTRRLDLAIEVDLVEEIARSQGYDRIPAELPVLASSRGGRSRTAELVLAASGLLTGAGLDEIVSHSLVHPRVYDRLRIPAESPLRECLTIANPLYEERATLRTTMLPTLLDTVHYNANRQTRDLGIFEISHIYRPMAGEPLPAEPLMLAIALMGNQAPAGWNSPAAAADFFVLKGLVERLLEGLDVQGWSVERASHPSLHPGRQAHLLVGGAPAGVFGEIHPAVQAAWDLPDRVYVAELDFGALSAAARPQREYRPVPRYPAAIRDLALVLADSVDAVRIDGAIRQVGGELVESVVLFDLYQGEHVPADHRSLAFRITYRSSERTLTETDVEAVHSCVRQALAAMGAELRS